MALARWSSVIGILLLASRVHAQSSTEDRLRSLEQRLQQALQQIDQQRQESDRSKQEIGELRRALKEQQTLAAQPHSPVRTPAARAAAAPPELRKEIEDDVRAEVARDQADTHQRQVEIEQKVASMQPAWQDYATRMLGKFKLSTLFYGDYAFYQKTGFGPQFLTQINPPGPGNDDFSSFDITRTYLNLFFSPTDDVTFRLTPNIYRTIGGNSRSFGKSGGLGTNLDGNLGFRLKYAYLDFNKPFARLAALVPALAPLAEDKVTFGQQPNPLIGWEEDLYGYRYVNLAPWNYASLSSTQTGLSSHGPVKFGGRQFIDYDLGVYTNASFHATEEGETKQGMARVSFYPLGAGSRFDGLGITGFFDYGFPNKTLDSGRQSHVSRLAALVHYTTDWWGLAAEYDQGHNAFSSGNLFSGSGPADEFGVGKTSFARFDTLVRALQNNGRSTQQGFAFLGHLDIPNTPFSVFGMYQQFLPNTAVRTNPIDFRRIVGGLSYRYDKYLRFALDVQDLDYYHDQFTFSRADANGFGAKLKSDVAGAVPEGIRAVFLNVEFSY